MSFRRMLSMRSTRLFCALLLLAPLLHAQDVSSGAEEWWRDHAARFAGAKHYLLEADHALRAEERNELTARGMEVQESLPGNRYIVRVAKDAAIDSEDSRVRQLAELTPSLKMQRAAWREVASGKAYSRLDVVFHDDVDFESARSLVDEAGGMLERPLATGFSVMHNLRVRIPSSAALGFVSDERVRAVFGPALHAISLNDVSASVSNVTPLYSGPYNLTGSGVTLTVFEISPADATHPEFGGRVTVHGSGPSSDVEHATHVVGTVAASGIQPKAKGMAPGAKVEQYIVDDNFLDTKNSQLATVGTSGDNNSWGYILGWCDSSRCTAPSGWVWTGNADAFGGYDITDSTIDKIARTKNVLMIHSAGNDANTLGPLFTPFQHNHQDENGDLIKNETFCYSPSGNGGDCPAPPTCTSGANHCETVHHPANGPVTSVGLTASSKNIITVGAIDSNRFIASFSSQGPTRDGRVKPDVVAVGVNTYSTFPSNTYGTLSGTSMSSPVVTGISGMLTEQWHKTFSNANPLPVQMKAVIIAGADDLGRPGPDFVYGFGLADAKASADLIIADGATGKRMKLDSVGQGSQISYPITVGSQQNLRVVLAWTDPEVLNLGDTDLAGKTLVNDLDLKLTDPNGNTVLPYVLDANNPGNNATRGVNSVDNVEEVEVANAAPGTYTATVSGKALGAGPTQQYALVANAALGSQVIPCSDAYEPNETKETAFGNVTSGQTVSAKTCTASDSDFFKLSIDRSGPLVVNVTTTDTPVTVTITGDGISSPVVTNVGAGSTTPITVQIGTGTKQLLSPARTIYIQVVANGTIGSNAGYSITPTYVQVAGLHRRAATH